MAHPSHAVLLLDEAGVSATAITEQQLADRQYPMMLELLREIPGMNVVKNSRAGGVPFRGVLAVVKRVSVGAIRVWGMDRFRVVPAAYVVLRRGDEVLMMLRANTGYMDGYWAVPAGHVERGESVVAAAVREVREEIGVELGPGTLVPVKAMIRTGGNGDPIDERVDFFFLTTRWSGEPRLMEPDKADVFY